ncbi:MFS transporter [Izhakiella australiensis]|uniref:MFS transporter n=1 Tax=Izhakiella australiensis TaxID=1926881 RepID=A0A1S8YTJ1_9GAMM|nr:MFS transporter [Izhakiella australiensis]OON42156.1 MFS transporter [Izhakiella australiensis]
MNGHENKAVRSANRKFFARTIPMLVLMLIINQIDRTNIGFIKHSLETDVGISTAAFGFGAGLFFIGYALFEVPSNMLMDKYGARVWLTRIMITWGAVVLAMGFVTTPMQFYILRFLLGVAEAGFFPGILFYFRKWVPNVYRGRATALILTGSAAAYLLSGPVTGGLLELHDFMGLPGWQWVLFIEGALSILVGIVAAFILVSRPEEAKWLSTEEKQALSLALQEEASSRDLHSGEKSRWKLITDGKMAYLCFLFFVMCMTGYTLVFWQPEIIGRIQGLSPFQIGLLNSVPWICAIISINILGRVSDRFRGNRETILALALIVAALGTCLCTIDNPWFGLVSLCIVCIGTKSSAVLFWPIPQSQLPTSIVAPGIALINSLGNLGGFFAPTVFGVLQQTTGSTTAGLYILSAISVLAAITLFFTKTTRTPGQPEYSAPERTNAKRHV